MTDYEKQMIEIEKDKMRLMCVTNDALRILIKAHIRGLSEDDKQPVIGSGNQMIGEINTVTSGIMKKYDLPTEYEGSTASFNEFVPQ